MTIPPIAKSMALSLAICLAAISTPDSFAAEPPASRATAPRTGVTRPFGSGSLTTRSDGSSQHTQPFGTGTLTTEKSPTGKTITGTTTKFGNGSITRWSDGTTTGTTERFGSGTLTTRSDGSSSRSQSLGRGAITTEKPKRK